jgi:hypothetical protein
MALPREPMAVAPKDRPIRLVFKDQDGQWISHAEYQWMGGHWCSARSGFRVPSHLTILGWLEPATRSASDEAK